MTTATTNRTSIELIIEALPADELNRIRQAGRDDSGNQLVPFRVDAGSFGSPLRCCLRDAAEGELIVLIAYRPRGGAGAYAEVGPVFIHAQACGGYRTVLRYPEGFRHRQQVFRAYDGLGRICDAVVVEGADAESVLRGLLQRSEVAVVQSRNVRYGCFMFLVSRRISSAVAGLHESALVGEDDSLDAVARTQLGEQVRDVRLDGAFA